MKNLSKYSDFVPYFYFLTVIGCWFTDVNRTEGIDAFPILLFGLPFLWRFIGSNKKWNSTFIIPFIYLAMYFILTNVLDFTLITSVTNRTIDFVFYGGLFVISLTVIEFWIAKNRLKQSI